MDGVIGGGQIANENGGLCHMYELGRRSNGCRCLPEGDKECRHFSDVNGGFSLNDSPLDSRRTYRRFQGVVEFEWGVYVLSASEAIFRAGTYIHTAV